MDKRAMENRAGQASASEAWAAALPDLCGACKNAFPRRAAAVTPSRQVEAEDEKFARIDLSNAF